MFGPFPPLSSPKDDVTPKSGNLFQQRSSGHSTMAAHIVENFVGSTSDLPKKGKIFHFHVFQTVRFVSVNRYFIEMFHMYRRIRNVLNLSNRIFYQPKQDKAAKKGQNGRTKITNMCCFRCQRNRCQHQHRCPQLNKNKLHTRSIYCNQQKRFVHKIQFQKGSLVSHFGSFQEHS